LLNADFRAAWDERRQSAIFNLQFVGVISVDHVTRRFGDRTAVEDVSFDVHAGEVFGLLGPNGAGKTTTLRMLGGLIPPTSGSIRIDGQAFTRESANALRRRIGFLTETPGLWDQLTVEDNLLVYARLFSVANARAAVQRTLEMFTLWDRRRDRVALLSKGMKQKLAIARALVHDPDVVLLDEPTANLDPQTARTVRDMLQELRAAQRAVIVSTHNLDEVERVANRVALVSGRLIAIGEPATLRNEVFGHRLRVRLEGSAEQMLAFSRLVRQAGAHDVRIDGTMLSMATNGSGAATPAIVRALVEAGAAIYEVTDDAPSLEDVYLRLLSAPGANSPLPTGHWPLPS
jgi:ABC-2 type transport system ATP-binding protein